MGERWGGGRRGKRGGRAKRMRRCRGKGERILYAELLLQSLMFLFRFTLSFIEPISVSIFPYQFKAHVNKIGVLQSMLYFNRALN